MKSSELSAVPQALLKSVTQSISGAIVEATSEGGDAHVKISDKLTEDIGVIVSAIATPNNVAKNNPQKVAPEKKSPAVKLPKLPAAPATGAAASKQDKKDSTEDYAQRTKKTGKTIKQKSAPAASSAAAKKKSAPAPSSAAGEQEEKKGQNKDPAHRVEKSASAASSAAAKKQETKGKRPKGKAVDVPKVAAEIDDLLKQRFRGDFYISDLVDVKVKFELLSTVDKKSPHFSVLDPDFFPSISNQISAQISAAGNQTRVRLSSSLSDEINICVNALNVAPHIQHITKKPIPTQQAASSSGVNRKRKLSGGAEMLPSKKHVVPDFSNRDRLLNTEYLGLQQPFAASYGRREGGFERHGDTSFDLIQKTIPSAHSAGKNKLLSVSTFGSVPHDISSYERAPTINRPPEREYHWSFRSLRSLETTISRSALNFHPTTYRNRYTTDGTPPRYYQYYVATPPTYYQTDACKTAISLFIQQNVPGFGQWTEIYPAMLQAAHKIFDEPLLLGPSRASSFDSGLCTLKTEFKGDVGSDRLDFVLSVDVQRSLERRLWVGYWPCDIKAKWGLFEKTIDPGLVSAPRNFKMKNSLDVPPASTPVCFRNGLKLKGNQPFSLSWMYKQEGRSRDGVILSASQRQDPFSLRDVLVSSVVANGSREFKLQIDQSFPQVRGGILGDTVGYGKTACMIATIAQTQSDARVRFHTSISEVWEKKMAGSLVVTPATLIVTPMNLLDQWEQEINKFVDDKKQKLVVVKISTQNDMSARTVGDILQADIVLVSFQFFTWSRSYVLHFDQIAYYQGWGGKSTIVSSTENILLEMKAIMDKKVFGGIPLATAERLKVCVHEMFAAERADTASVNGDDLSTLWFETRDAVQQAKDKEEDVAKISDELENVLKTVISAVEKAQEEHRKKVELESSSKSSGAKNATGDDGLDETLVEQQQQRAMKSTYLGERLSKLLCKNAASLADATLHEQLLKADALFEGFYWHRVVFDEFHEVVASKDQRSSHGTRRDELAYNQLCHIQARFRWGLTATPMLDSVESVDKMANLLHVAALPRSSKAAAPATSWQKTQQFVDHFIRSNCWDSGSIPIIRQTIKVRHTRSERVLYLHQRQALRQYTTSRDARERLLQLCTHFDPDNALPGADCSSAIEQTRNKNRKEWDHLEQLIIPMEAQREELHHEVNVLSPRFKQRMKAIAATDPALTARIEACDPKSANTPVSAYYRCLGKEQRSERFAQEFGHMLFSHASKEFLEQFTTEEFDVEAFVADEDAMDNFQKVLQQVSKSTKHGAKNGKYDLARGIFEGCDKCSPKRSRDSRLAEIVSNILDLKQKKTFLDSALAFLDNAVKSLIGAAKGQEKEVQECPFCMDEMNGDDSCLTQCGHAFHTECINEIIEAAHGYGKCPMCRNPISKKDLTTFDNLPGVKEDLSGQEMANDTGG